MTTNHEADRSIRVILLTKVNSSRSPQKTNVEVEGMKYLEVLNIKSIFFLFLYFTFCHYLFYSRSKIPHAPIPVPIHMDTTPSFLS